MSSLRHRPPDEQTVSWHLQQRKFAQRGKLEGPHPGGTLQSSHSSWKDVNANHSRSGEDGSSRSWIAASVAVVFGSRRMKQRVAVAVRMRER